MRTHLTRLLTLLVLTVLAWPLGARQTPSPQPAATKDKSPAQ